MQLASSRPDLAQLRVLGASASAVIVVGSAPGLASSGVVTEPTVVWTYLGLALLAVAWWRLGGLVHARRGVAIDTGHLRGVLLWWAAPLLLGPPLFSRDVYSYLAQGAMVNAGIDIYQHGPAALGGPLAAEVPSIWQYTPAPYGPGFVLYAAVVTSVSGTSLALGVFGMRLVALLGIALLVWALPRLAERCGASPASALWLGVLNPLVLLHGVSGAHNDALMLGLLAAGLAVAVGRPRSAARLVLPPWLGLATGAALIALAALVKVPAGLGLGFLLPLWAAGRTGRLARTGAGLAIAGVAAGCTLAVTALAGTGFGWTRVLGTPASAGNWSPTSVLGRLTAAVLGTEEAMAWWRWAGVAAALAIGCALWWNRERVGPVRALGLTLAGLVVLGPAFRPWYLLWGIVPLAATLLDERDARVRQWLATSCAALSMVVLPDGFAPDLAEIGEAALGIGIALTALLAMGRLTQPRAGAVPVFQR